MRLQKLVPIKNIKQINEFLGQGWNFDHMVGDKYALLSLWQNDTRNGARATLGGLDLAIPTPTFRGE